MAGRQAMNTLCEGVEEYLSLRHRLGYKLDRSGRLLLQFVSFMEQRKAPFITGDLVEEWAVLPTNAQPVYWASRLSAVRLFAQYRRATDSRTEVPALGLLRARYQRKRPYIYSENEIARLMGAAARLASPTGLRAQTYVTLLGLLTVTGLRISEAIALDCEDVDLEGGILTIRRTKFGKTRLVPVHRSTSLALRRYARFRDGVHPRPRTRSFLVGEAGARLVKNTAEDIFVRLSRRIGLRGPEGRHGHGPRLHDLRHRWAVDTMLRWYRAGVDVERHLPELSTYLGHTHVSDSYWYLTAVPELMSLAMSLLERDRTSP
jgi:integrase/recombinase XerD